MEVGEARIDVGLTDIDLHDAGGRGVAPAEHTVDDAVGEAHPTDEVPLRLGLGEGDDAALELEHQRFLSTWAAAASDADSGVAPRAAAQLGIDTL